MGKKKKTAANRGQDDGVLKVSVENFGPIVEGDVEIRPLTFFIGPNGCGKTYLSVALFTFLRTKSEQILERAQVLEMRLAKQLRRAENPDAAVMLVLDALASIIVSAAAEMGGICARLPQNLGVEGKEMPRHGSELAEIHVEDRFGRFTFRWQKDGAATFSRRVERLRIRKDLEELKKAWQIRRGESHRRSKRGVTEKGIWGYISELSSVTGFVPSIMRQRLFPFSVQSQVAFIPDGRTGLLRCSSEVAPFLMAGGTPRGLRGVDRDFLAMWTNLLNMLGGKKVHLPPLFPAMAKECEIGKEAWREGIGSVFLSAGGEDRVSLTRAPSGIVESFPLLLFVSGLKAMLGEEQGVFVVIDEPEAHLHPTAQTELATLLSRWIRQGHRFLLATHSDFLVEQLSNLVMRSGIPKGRRPERGIITKDDELKREDVAVYRFKYDADAGGYRIEEVPIGTEEGIEEREFGVVRDALYDEYEELWNIQHRILEESSGK